MQNMSRYQIGTKPGHRASEHLFVIKSVIGLYEQMGKNLMLQLWDISKYFDRESLADGLNEVYKNNVRGKIYKLLHEMNKDTRIKVRTPVGDIEERDVGEGWGQGTIEGAICSAANLDNGVVDFSRPVNIKSLMVMSVSFLPCSKMMSPGSVMTQSPCRWVMTEWRLWRRQNFWTLIWISHALLLLEIERSSRICRISWH